MKHPALCLIGAIAFAFIITACDKRNLDDPVNFNIADSEPAWSPDGQRIAFVHGSMPNDGIYLIRPNGTGNQLWHGGMADSPTWSPCGQ